MKTYLDTLRPSEKRLVVGVGLMLFVVLNFWFVFPHFSDKENLKIRITNAQKKLELYNATMQQAAHKQAEIKRMEGDGYSVPAEDQAMHFQTTVQTMAAQAGIGFQSVGRVTQRTNQFFLELSQPVTLTSREEALINFLYNLGSGASLIRVRDLGVRPDAPRLNLSASIKLVASYQKKAPVRAGAATPATGGKPAPAPIPLPATSSKRP